jgi:hypothetical protein
MMKKLILTAALATLLASPAFEVFAREQGRAAAGATHQQGARAAYAQDRNAAFAQDPGVGPRFSRDPAEVVVNGRYIGRDPDPNIRLELLRDADMSEF